MKMNNSDSLFEKRNHKKVSSMVKAMQGWESSLAKPSSPPSGQFGRVVKITTKSGLTLDNSLDLEFEVPFDDDTEADEATITVYNLSKDTIGRLKVNDEITITAGYKDDTGVIFAGVISTVKTKWNGQDKVTTITAIDDTEQREKKTVSYSFKAGIKAKYILRLLVHELGLPIAVFEITKDFTYTGGAVVSGELMDAIRQYAEVCGAKAYINKRKIYVQDASKGEDLKFTVNTDTGLLGSPEEFSEEEEGKTVKGVKFKMLLEHRVTTASIINLKSRDFTGKYRVREGTHACNETDFYTEVTAIG